MDCGGSLSLGSTGEQLARDKERERYVRGPGGSNLTLRKSEVPEEIRFNGRPKTRA